MYESLNLRHLYSEYEDQSYQTISKLIDEHSHLLPVHVFLEMRDTITTSTRKHYRWILYFLEISAHMYSEHYNYHAIQFFFFLFFLKGRLLSIKIQQCPDKHTVIKYTQLRT